MTFLALFFVLFQFEYYFFNPYSSRYLSSFLTFIIPIGIFPPIYIAAANITRDNGIAPLVLLATDTKQIPVFNKRPAITAAKILDCTRLVRSMALSTSRARTRSLKSPCSSLKHDQTWSKKNKQRVDLCNCIASYPTHSSTHLVAIS